MGGPSSFQQKFAAGLAGRGVDVCFDLTATPFDAVLVNGGTRHLDALWHTKRRGVRIVQRLDGINWLQRHRRTTPRHFLRAEINNLLLALIRGRLSDRVIYQSQFVRRWWKDWYGEVGIPGEVIYNAVDLRVYSPAASPGQPSNRCRLLLVEGSLAGIQDVGLNWGVQLAEALSQEYHLAVELVVAGRVDTSLQDALVSGARIPIEFLGVVSAEKIPQIDRSADLYFSAELNPPCPNSVIEALACGLPVIGFETGSLSELVTPDAGRLVPFGSDPWKIGTPDILGLAGAAASVLKDLPRYRRGARARAESAFALERMVERYTAVLLD